jgi:tRNA (guanosine-2'-O-)-methyltransferase
MPNERRVLRLREVLERRQEDLAVVVENVWDPHNASAIVRSADGFAAGTVHLLYTIEEAPDLSRGVSAYTDKWTSLERHDDTAELVATLRERGQRIYATALDEAAVDYLEVDWTEPAALVLGNEQRGCSEELLAAADAHVTIPMLGFAQSFNVSVAAAVVLAEVARQRREAGLLEPSWSDAKQRLFDYWIAREEAREQRLPAPMPPEGPLAQS